MKEITFDMIKNANESIKTTDIKGKEYAEVNQRIKAFRMVYPDGFINTELVSNEDGICIFRALVGRYTENGIDWLGTGTAYEKENSTFINKTSYIENCETSAVGRALGMAGFGIDTSIASYEEVSNAQMQQQANETISEIEQKALIAMFEQNGQTLADCLKWFKVDDVAKITAKQYADFMHKLNSKGK